MPIHEHEETVIDEDGTVKRTTKSIYQRVDEPRFVKLYVDAWVAFKCGNKNVNSDFLFALLPYMHRTKIGKNERDKLQNIIDLNAGIREDIAQAMGWKNSGAAAACSRELKKLCAARALCKIRTNRYMVNPELIGDARWTDVKNLKATFNLRTGQVTHDYSQAETFLESITDDELLMLDADMQAKLDDDMQAEIEEYFKSIKGEDHEQAA